MYNSGFVLLYRDEMDDWLFEDKTRFMWWLQLRMKAVVHPRTQSIGQTRINITVNYGEFATTIRYLSALWQANSRAVTNFLQLLEENGRIATRREGNILVIKICDFEKFSPPPGYFKRGGKAEENEASLHTPTPTQTQTEIQPQTQSLVHDVLQTQAQPNNINLETEKKEKEQIISEKEREREFFERFRKAGDEERHFMCKTINCSEEDLPGLIDQFEGSIMNGDEFHKTYEKFKFHMGNWCRKIHRDNQAQTTSKPIKSAQNDKRKQTEEARPKSSAAQRRGYEGQPRPDEAFQRPFPTRPTD